MKLIFTFLTACVLYLSANANGVMKNNNKNLVAKDFVEIGNITYYISPRENFGINALEATRACNALGMKLVSFETQEKWTSVQDFLDYNGYSNQYFWSSGRRYSESWLWTGTGQEISYFSWAENQPEIGGLNDCIIVMSISQWWDSTCNAFANYICEY